MVPEELPLSLKVAAAGSAACFADFITFPLDTAKVRLQLQGESGKDLKKTIFSQSAGNVATNATVKAVKQVEYKGLIGTLVTIYKKEGPKSLFNGLSAGLQRQLCFASVRLGMYDTVKCLYHQVLDGNSPNISIISRIAAGMTTGSLAVLIAQPTDVVKVRFQAQLRGNANNRYSNTIQAYSRIAREEGARGLWKGTASNASRNAIVNVSEIVCYDIIKEFFVSRKIMDDAVPCHFTSAVIAGLAATVVASPVDVVKTRYMNSKPGTYTGAVGCAVEMFSKEGFSAFYKGFTPSFCRLVSWNIVLWLSYEQIKLAINTHILEHDEKV
uniref:Mitochondrial uncoupling protein 2 n=1 Tax=Cacopsylla melanoneura TaxID=428564 RepID=A0A8D9A3P7_9HEMI